MSKVFEWKGYLIKYYAKYSVYVDKVLKFLLAFLTFTYINQQIGFSQVVSNPIMTVILSVICMLLPLTLIVVVATLVILFQTLTVSLGMAIVALALILILYAFYFRYATGKAVLMIVVPIAFMLHIPIAVPIVFALVGGPIYLIPISAGTILHYMIEYVQTNSKLLQSAGESNMVQQVITYTQQFLMNPTMWCMVIAFVVTFLLVYVVRRMAVDHSWEIAIVAGILGNINVVAYGYIIMDIQIAYVSLIVGSLVSILAALIVKVFVFSVDYTRTEHLQFEDDEYYYYVKAVPKVSVAIPEKTVKTINERQKTGMIDTEQVRNLTQSEEDSEIQRIIEEELKQEK